LIPVCRPTFIKNEKNFVYEALGELNISSHGKFVEGFEELWSQYCGCKHGISCTNGTTALHLALLTLGIGKKDEVIVPNFCMIAVPNAVTYVGAKPVFVDVREDDWNIDWTQIEAKITRKTKAIMVVHNFGNPCNMSFILALAKKHNLFVIEDCSEAHGATYNGQKVSSFGDVAIFSFYANKIITTGEGGMLITNDTHISNRCKYLRNHCFDKPRFIHQEIGYNYRMSNLHCAIGVAQASQADKLIEMRNEVSDIYTKELKNIKGITIQPKVKGSVCWMFCILVEDKDGLMAFLEKTGIETRSLFYPNHLQPCYKHLKIKGKFPVSEMLWEKGLYLPTSTDLTDLEIKKICETIRSYQNG